MKRVLWVALVCGWAGVSCLGAPYIDFWGDASPPGIPLRTDNLGAQPFYDGNGISDAAAGVTEPTAGTATDPVPTFCIPAPGALLLAGLGAAAVGWLRTRRSL